MNIFLLDEDLEKSAEYHVDKHVIKMRTEYNQLLSSAHLMTGGTAPYRLTHKNHPAALWVRENIENYILLWNLNYFLCKEYVFRYGNKEQISLEVLNKLKKPPKIKNIKEPSLPYSVWKEKDFPELKKSKNIVKTNREFYKAAKQHLIKYKNREVPEWLI